MPPDTEKTPAELYQEEFERVDGNRDGGRTLRRPRVPASRRTRAARVVWAVIAAALIGAIAHYATR